MTDALIAVLFFVTGTPVAYLLFRRNHIKVFGTWTVSDRTLALVCSIGGWVSVLAALFASGIGRSEDDDNKPATW